MTGRAGLSGEIRQPSARNACNASPITLAVDPYEPHPDTGYGAGTDLQPSAGGPRPGAYPILLVASHCPAGLTGLPQLVGIFAGPSARFACKSLREVVADGESL